MPRTLPTRFALPRILAAALIAGLALTPGAAPAKEPERWLHVAVDGTPENPDRVRIHLPMKLVAALEPLVAKYGFGQDDFKCRIDGASFDRADLIAILDAVDQAKDGELIAVDDASDHVRVKKEKNDLVIHVTEKGKDSGERVDVRVPIKIARALAGGKDDELDLAAALAELSRTAPTELVSVHDDGERVRIWIDDKNTSD